MKTQILLKMVKNLLPATEKKGLIPGADTITCENGNLTTYNDKISISYLTPTALIEKKFSVDAEDLYQTLKTVKAKDVEIDIKNNDLVITSSDVLSTLAIKSSDRISDMIAALDISALNFQDLPSTFIEGLSLCKDNTSTNVRDPDKLFCAAVLKNSIITTDKYRISIFTDKSWDMERVLIPYYTLPFICAFNPDGYTIQNGWIHFINEDDAILSSKMLYDEETFVKFQYYQKVITNNKFHSKLELPEDLLDTLENMISFTDADHIIDKIVTLNFNKEVLTCSLKKKTGVLSKYLKLKEDTLKGTFHFNAVFLKEVLQYISTIHLGDKCIKLQTKHFVHLLASTNY